MGRTDFLALAPRALHLLSLRRLLNTPKYRKRLEALGSAPVKPMSVQEVRTTIERDYAEVKQAVKELGIKF